MAGSSKHFTEYCAAHGLRITPPRLAVYEVLSAAKKPLSAYDVLDALKSKLDNPKPPTAYRALEFLQKHGFVHRIESLNVYVSCGAGHNHRGSQFMICDECGRVEEIHLCSVPKGLQEKTKSKGFDIAYWNAEMHGRCGDCVTPK